jgi:hypothetical protein
MKGGADHDHDGRLLISGIRTKMMMKRIILEVAVLAGTSRKASIPRPGILKIEVSYVDYINWCWLELQISKCTF